MPKGRIIGVVAIIAVLAGFAWLAIFGMNNSTTNLPSALIGKPFPEFDLTAVGQPSKRITKEAILGKPAVVNVWATWCRECLHELPTLSRLSKQGVPIYGVNYKDLDSDTIQKWMTEYEHPYVINISDPKGTLSLALGVYGAPETFLIDKKGIIRYKLIGLITEENWSQVLAPIYQELLNE